MTREEAINNLNMISVAFVEPVTKEQRKLIDDTFDMAIKALEQNESAEEWYKLFVEKLEQEPKTGIENLCDSCTNKACEFQSGIQRSKCDFYIPPMPHLEPDNCGNYIVQQEPTKTGHWTRVSMDKYVQHAMAFYRCSECGEDIIGEHNYCPNCGARMVEPQESEDKE